MFSLAGCTENKKTVENAKEIIDEVIEPTAFELGEYYARVVDGDINGNFEFGGSIKNVSNRDIRLYSIDLELINDDGTPGDLINIPVQPTAISTGESRNITTTSTITTIYNATYKGYKIKNWNGEHLKNYIPEYIKLETTNISFEGPSNIIINDSILVDRLTGNFFNQSDKKIVSTYSTIFFFDQNDKIIFMTSTTNSETLLPGETIEFFLQP